MKKEELEIMETEINARIAKVMVNEFHLPISYQVRIMAEISMYFENLVREIAELDR